MGVVEFAVSDHEIVAALTTARGRTVLLRTSSTTAEAGPRALSTLKLSTQLLRVLMDAVSQRRLNLPITCLRLFLQGERTRSQLEGGFWYLEVL